jgi:hypothetical protein
MLELASCSIGTIELFMKPLAELGLIVLGNVRL